MGFQQLPVKNRYLPLLEQLFYCLIGNHYSPLLEQLFNCFIGSSYSPLLLMVKCSLIYIFCFTIRYTEVYS